MTTAPIAWVDELIPMPDVMNIGLESFEAFVQGQNTDTYPDYFKPVYITAKDGCYYATIHVCHLFDGTETAQSFKMWLATLKPTDQLHLTVMTFLSTLYPQSVLGLMTGLANTKANLIVYLDHVETTTAGYIYLLANEINVRVGGGLLLPSFVTGRPDDLSGPTRATLDFYAWLVDESVINHRLTVEQAALLKRGQSVVIDPTRLVTT